MQTLREKLHESKEFLFGVELVSIRGSMGTANAVKARTFAGQLVENPRVDWISVTDNAGGNPQLAPQALGRPILYAGKEVVLHLTCKDLNRNGLESKAWLLNSEGFHNVLAMTGDHPASGNERMAKPVFDIDSVGLICMLSKMNAGFDERHEKTQFCIGAVTTNYKLLEGEVVPQYLKLRKKIECGAEFIINQVGFDARKMHELRLYMDDHGIGHIPLIGNVYVLNARAARFYHENRVPGVVVTPALLELCVKHGASPDKGREFFLEFAAKQAAIYRGLGYRGAYLGGLHDANAVRRIMELERQFAADDWKSFAKELRFSRPGEFFYYEEDRESRLADRTRVAQRPKRRTVSGSLLYRLSRRTHHFIFTPGSGRARWGARTVSRSSDPLQGPLVMRAVERVSKSLLYRCKDCGDCSLPDIAFLCPESQCAKNQRNGPCGGSREGSCEVEGIGPCIWLRAYERLKLDGMEDKLLTHAPVVQDQRLRGTSSWANNWLGRDHASKDSKK
ncbi:MAG: methylenetetrahydrofolate reductase [Ignavibacteria bacterium]|nr:methylenetetrahydrofolate reductase [Ignavibacteria bacterium]